MSAPAGRDETLERVIAAVRRIVSDPELRAAIEARLVGLHTPQTPAGIVPAGAEEEHE